MPSIVKGFVFKTLTKVATLLRVLTLTLSKAIVVIKKTG
jgi:hypothetical protein